MANEEVVKSEVIESDFTERVLLSLVFDVSLLKHNVDEIAVKIFAIARERGIKPPED